MTKPIRTYEPYSVVVVPFPFTDSSNTKRRPALIISSIDFQVHNEHSTFLMITSARNSSWYLDHKILDLNQAGLKSESIIRQKIFTLDNKIIIRQAGKLSEKDIEQVKINLRKHVALK